MKTLLSALALSVGLIAATPAAAVTLVSATTGANTISPVEFSSSQVSVDFGLNSLDLMSLTLGVEAGDAATYNFDSSIEIFTGLATPPVGISSVRLSLTDGATFNLGSVSAFGNATAILNGAGNVLLVTLSPDEFVNVTLGSLVDTVGDFGINRNGLATGSTFGLSIAANPVPEPATWAMMIGGFGLLGGLARRRRATTAVLAA